MMSHELAKSLRKIAADCPLLSDEEKNNLNRSADILDEVKKFADLYEHSLTGWGNIFDARASQVRIERKDVVNKLRAILDNK